MRIADDCWDAMLGIASHGNLNCKSDLQVGARCLEVGIWGAWQNVLTNLPDITDEAYKQEVRNEAKALHDRAVKMQVKVLNKLQERSAAMC